MIPKIIPYSFLHIAFVKLTALLLLGFFSISFPMAHSPNLFRSVCNLSMSLLSFIFLYIIQSSANSRTLDSVLLQIPRNSTGPNTLPCSSPQVTLTSSDSCPSTLTLCELLKRFMVAKWDSDGFLSQYFYFPLSVSYQHFPVIFICSVISTPEFVWKLHKTHALEAVGGVISDGSWSGRET